MVAVAGEIRANRYAPQLYFGWRWRRHEEVTEDNRPGLKYFGLFFTRLFERVIKIRLKIVLSARLDRCVRGAFVL